MYCARAWWYQRQGIENANQAEMAAGTRLHHQHGRKVVASGLMRTLALVLLLVALMMLVSYYTTRII